jgi:hypothetical protein
MLYIDDSQPKPADLVQLTNFPQGAPVHALFRVVFCQGISDCHCPQMDEKQVKP